MHQKGATKLIKMTLSIMTFSKTKHSTLTVSITTLSITVLRIDNRVTESYKLIVVTRIADMLNVIILSVVASPKAMRTVELFLNTVEMQKSFHFPSFCCWEPLE